MLRRPYLLASITYLLSLLLLRHQLLEQYDVSYLAALSWGVIPGWLYDFSTLLLAIALGEWLHVFGLSRKVGWTFCTSIVWLSTLCSVLYQGFFGTRLDLWIVRLHFHDVFQVGGAAGDLGLHLPILLSAAFYFLTMGLIWKAKPWNPIWHRSGAGIWNRARALGAGALAVCLALLIKQSPVWFRLVSFDQVERGFRGTVLSDQAIYLWWDESIRTHEGIHVSGNTEGLTQDKALATLRRYVRGEETMDRSAAAHFSPTNQEFLDRKISFTPEQTRKARQELGLPTDGPIHVLIVFVESFRAFEFFHPQMGPKIFPRLKQALAKHGVEYRQTYSSSFEPGQTVRGVFSSLCSNLPNITGPAVYIAQNHLRVNCLPGLFSDAGYQTFSIQAFRSNFHNKQIFESLHGVKNFVDQDYFRERGITESLNQWGIPDRPFLSESLNLLQDRARNTQAPIFAHLVTTGTHFPHHFQKNTGLAEDLIQETASNPGYQAFLTRLRYADESIGAFLEKLFQLPMGDRTLVVVLGDHSIPEPKPHLPLKAQQVIEFQARIPLMLFTKHLPQHRVVSGPFHQIDLAMEIARISGVGGVVSWLGRGLQGDSGSPWVFQNRSQVNYRIGNTACYSLSKVGPVGHSEVHCYDVSKLDPLFHSELPVIPENVELTRFFKDVVRSNRLLISLNRLLSR